MGGNKYEGHWKDNNAHGDVRDVMETKLLI